MSLANQILKYFAMQLITDCIYYVKSVKIHGINFHIQYQCRRKLGPEKKPNSDTFHAIIV